MNNPFLLYNFLLCCVFLIANIKKVGLRNKTYILPSTLFALMWALTSLGGFLYSNKMIGYEDYYANAAYLEEIAEYQFCILCSCFLAFKCAHLRKRAVSAYLPSQFSEYNIPILRKKLRWVLYLFFIFGMVKLLMVLAITGFDYAAMRNFYVIRSVSSFDTNFNRICSYLMQVSVFYVCLLGIESASKGINTKQILIDLLLFCPYQLSDGGRLFVLSFFVPFLFSYFIIFTLQVKDKSFKRKEKKKILYLILSPFILMILFQILKMGQTVGADSFREYSTEIFYTSSAYRHINEFWAYLPPNFEYEYGRNILGMASSVYTNIIVSWDYYHNAAAVCVPSMIPQMYLDFGKVGSLIVYFFLFYNLEKYALKCLSHLTLKSFLFYMLLCLTAFHTTGSSLSDCIRGLIVGYILISLLSMYTVKKNKFA